MRPIHDRITTQLIVRFARAFNFDSIKATVASLTLMRSHTVYIVYVFVVSIIKMRHYIFVAVGVSVYANTDHICVCIVYNCLLIIA